MRIRASAVGALLCGLGAGSAHAHGVVGQRSFIEPFIAEDVNPKNEFVIGRPEWDHSRDGRFEISTDRSRTTTLAHNVAIEYSVPYLQQAVRDFGLPWPLNDSIGDTEFSFEHGVNGEEQGRSKVFVTPGFVYMDRYVELGVAGRFPLNQAANDELDWGVIFIVDLFIDDILPRTRWQPIGGMRPPTPMPGTAAS